MGERALLTCHRAVVTLKHNVKPTFLADFYWRKLAALLHEVDEAFYFLRLQIQWRLRHAAQRLHQHQRSSIAAVGAHRHIIEDQAAPGEKLPLAAHTDSTLCPSVPIKTCMP